MPKPMLAEIVQDTGPIIDPPRNHNQPPEKTPYEKAQARIDDLHGEALLWLDGNPVDSQALCDDISNLKSTLRTAWDEAEEQRKIEKKPFDEGAAEVQKRYKPLLAKAESAIDACKKAEAPWLKKLDDDLKEAARIAREEADAKLREAAAAIKAADATNLAARERAENLVTEAKRAERVATKASNATANAGGAVGRRSGLRSVWTAKLDNFSLALGHYVMAEPEQLREFLQSLADTEVRHGKREIPGFKIVEEQTVV